LGGILGIRQMRGSDGVTENLRKLPDDLHLVAAILTASLKGPDTFADAKGAATTYYRMVEALKEAAPQRQ